MKTTYTKMQTSGNIKKLQPDYQEEEIFFYHVLSKTLVTLLFIFLLVFSSFRLFAQTPGTAINELDASNIRAKIMNGGDMFWDLQNAGFEVPKNSSKHTIFTSALWIGGLDAGNNLYMAAQTYRQTGNDFWPGPIDLNGNPSVSSSWDYVWKVNKSTIDYHIMHWSDAGYVVPQELADWPANGTPPFAPILAPFIDLNSNLVYEPALGEFPFILGDQATYDIFNDVANVHTETGGMPLGIEVHQLSYEINSAVDSFLTNTVFMRYEVGNRSDTSYHDVYLGIWTDFDIGNAIDDYVGTDVGRNMVYGYNGDSNDEGASGYGLNPPAQGVLFLSHPISHSLYYNNVNSVPNGNPMGAQHYYNYLMSVWGDGLPMTHSCDGRDQGAPLANFMYPGDTDPAFTDNLTEATCSNAPEDRRMLGSIGPLTLPADSFFVVDVAFVYARGDSGAWSSVQELQIAADSIINRYAGGTLTPVLNAEPVPLRNNILIYPNPVSGTAFIEFSNLQNESFSLSVLDIIGKTVLTQENIRTGKATISVDKLSPGIYSIRLQSPKNIYSGKVVVK